MAQNYPVSYPANYPVSVQNVQKHTKPIGGISVEHPLQATVYAFRRGKMKLLVPFEITVVPMGGIDAERPPASNGYPFSGPIQQQPLQPGVRYPPHTGNVYGQQAGIYQGSPNYYPISRPYQQPYKQPYNPYYPNGNGYYNQQPVQHTYYGAPSPPRRAGFPQYQPQFQQVGK